MDLSDRDRSPIAAATHAAILSALGRIPGITPSATGAVEWRMSKPVPGHPQGRPHMRIAFEGWSPSLHMAQIAIGLDPIHGTDDPALGPWTLRQLAPVLNAQRARVRAGLAYGIATPLTCSPAFYGPTEMRHLHIDASFMQVAADNGLVDLTGVLTEAVKLLLDGDDEHDGGPVVTGDAGLLMETGPRGSIRVIGTQIVLRSEPGHSITFDGRRIEIHGQILPATVLAAAVGRTLGDVIEVHPALDRRAIACIEQLHTTDGGRKPGGGSHPMLRVSLAPDWVRWVDVPTLNSMPKERT